MSSIINMRNENVDIIVHIVKTAKALDAMVGKTGAEYGLTKTQMEMLLVLQHSILDEITATDIAKELAVSKANVSGVISRLENLKLIVKKTAPFDSRVQFIEMTTKAWKIIHEVKPKYFKRVSDALEKFSGVEKKKLVKQLSHIESYMRTAEEV